MKTINPIWVELRNALELFTLLAADPNTTTAQLDEVENRIKALELRLPVDK